MKFQGLPSDSIFFSEKARILALFGKKTTEQMQHRYFNELIKNPYKKIIIPEYDFRSTIFISDTFTLLSFLKHLITKIGPKFQTLISN